VATGKGSGAPVRRHRFWWWLLLGVLVLGVAGFFWWRARNQQPKYVTSTVTQGTIQRAVSMTGALNPLVTVQVGSYVSGTLKKLYCDFNTEVVVGQVCATIDPVPFQLIVDQDKAQLGTAQAQLKKDQAAQTYAKIAFERDSNLLKEGTVSQDTVDNDKSVYDQSVAQVGLDQASIVDKQAALQAAEVNLAYTNIVSPVIGTVITRSIDVGQTVAASLQSPTLFLIGKDLTKMQVDTNVSEADVGDVRTGQDANFTVQAFPGRTFHGKVTQIRRGPITVQNVVTYDVVVAFDNPQRLLFPGMTADTHIVIDEHRNVLRVPLPAIRFTPEGITRTREGGGNHGGGGGNGAAGATAGAAGSATGGQETAATTSGQETATATGGQGPAAAAGGPEAGAAPTGRAPTGTASPAATGAPGGGEHRHRPGAPGSAGGEGEHRHRRGGEGGPPAGAGAEDQGGGGESRYHRGGGDQGGTGGAGRYGHADQGAAGEQGGNGGGEGRYGRGDQGATGGEGRHRHGDQGNLGGDHPRGQGRQAGLGEHRARVWVLRDGKLHPVMVTTGLDDGALIEVSSPDLHPGDKVVVNEASQEDRRRAGLPNQGQGGFRPGGVGGPGGPGGPGGAGAGPGRL
jgi:HlyD family secretion protein